MFYEIGTCRWTTSTGVDPLPVLTGRTGQHFRGRTIGFPLRLGDQQVIHQRSFLADVDGRRYATAWFEILWAGRRKTAVVPGDRYGRQSATGRKFILYFELTRVDFRVYFSANCLDSSGLPQLQRLKDCRENMATHVPKGSGPEIPPVSPSPWMIGRVVGALRRRPQPQVPIQPVGYGGSLRRTPALCGRIPEPRSQANLHFMDGADSAI